MSRSESPMRDEDLNNIRKLEASATPGPWGYHTMDEVVEVAAGIGPGTIGSVSYVQRIARLNEDDVYDDEAHGDWDADDARVQTEANAVFIAAARQDIPALLAEVTRLRARVADLETQ